MIPDFSWVKVLIAVAIAAALTTAWFGWLGMHDSKVATAATKAERDQWEARDAKTARDNAKETARLAAAQQESNREARKFIEQAAAAAAVDRDSRERVHNDLAAATAARRAADPATVTVCAPAEAAADLHADLFARADAAAGELAAYATEARGAGLACEREHDALTGARP